ncbi:DUF1572 domain-containing protein [bacterium]|nr:DUF1572 domain-containing protein [bacterium]
MATVEQYFLRESARFLEEEFLPKIEEATAKLTKDELWKRANPESNSVGNLLLHLAGNVRQHIIAGIGGADDIRIRHREFKETERPPKEILLKNLRDTVEEACSVIENLDPDLLISTKTIQDKQVRVLEDILHVVEHFSYHTGQIIYQVKAVKDTSFPWYDYLKDT